MADTAEKDISGDLPLEKIEEAIAAFELGFAKYLSNKISAVGGPKINTITFEKLILKRPTEFKLTLRTAQPPSGFSKIRDDVMFVGGKTENVTAWRKDAAS
ncbi:MAG: hypothetical protein Q8S00_26730 [Deltaproteobacteria bacterium]|nr:hypothetical protein [Deltaproteobacteria bacterium]MDZ4347391.1 hypothetical protein [Candidatus Binatia bacterium]